MYSTTVCAPPGRARVSQRLCGRGWYSLFPPTYGHVKAEPPYVIHIGRFHIYGLLRLGQFMETESSIEGSGHKGEGRKGPMTSLSTEPALGDGNCGTK